MGKSWKSHDILYTWDINVKAINEKENQMETHGRGQWTNGYQKWGVGK